MQIQNWYKEISLITRVCLVSLALFVLSSLSYVEGRTYDSKLLIISYDGFSPSYFDTGITPNMEKFRSEGTTAAYLKNVFPTKTFPNHQTIATGLFPAEHGVLGDNIYDLDLGPLRYGPQLYSYNADSIQPIWVANELAGGKSGCIMWPGSEFYYTIHQTTCSLQVKFNLSVSWEERLNEALDFFERGANLVMMYIEEPDQTGHRRGVKGVHETTEIKRVDQFTKLVDEKTRDQKINVILLSDHGMINTTPSKFINLTDYLPQHKEKIYGMSPVMQIYPVEVDPIYRVLINASVSTGAFRVYRNSELPDRWKYKNSRRTGPLTVVAEPPYAFDDMWPVIEYYEKHGVPRTNTSQYGMHGYDNELRSMNSFFMAKGPAIKTHHIVQPFDTVDLFHLFCEILGIKPPIVSGNRDNIMDILLSYEPPQESSIIVNVLIVLSILLIVFATAGAVYLVRRRNRDTQVVPPYVYDEPEFEDQKLLEISTNILPDLKL